MIIVSRMEWRKDVKNNYKAVQTTKNERELRLTEIFKANLIAYMITVIIFIVLALLLTYTPA